MEQKVEPRNKPNIYGQYVYDKRVKDMQWWNTVSINGVGKTGQPHAKERNYNTII